MKSMPAHQSFFCPLLGIALGVLICGALAGCQTAHVADPLTRTVGASDPDTQMEFWYELEARPVTCNDEAFHGLLLFLDGTDSATDYEQRVQSLRSRGLLAPRFSAPADAAVQRGQFAVSVAKALRIKGGVMMRLTGGNIDRYALRELVVLNLYPPGSVNQTFSGAEYVGIIGKMEDFQHGNSANYPAEVLPSEMNGGTAATRR
jgi:hypothetical protein